MDCSGHYVGTLGRFLIPPLKPDLAKHCIECNHVFSWSERKHNCKNCGHIVCSDCSTHYECIPKFGYHNPVRCCNTCKRLVVTQKLNREALEYKPSKHLEQYVDYYSIPSSNTNTKDGLITLILRTPIDNELECGYRLKRDGMYATQVQAFPAEGRYDENSSSHLASRWLTLPDQLLDRQYAARHRLSLPSTSTSTSASSDAIFSRQYPFDHPSCDCPMQTRTLLRNRLWRHSAYFYPDLLRPCSCNFRRYEETIDETVEYDTDPALMSMGKLERILRHNHVELSPNWKKSELVAQVRRLMRADQEDLEGPTNSQCCICLDSPKNCVLLDCGHMATCMECGVKLYDTTHQCPVCRATINKVVRVFHS